jgi:hypothetical protein
LKKTPAKRAMDWAKRHGRPMDSTVILAWEKGYNAARRDLRREVNSRRQGPDGFLSYGMMGMAAKEFLK